VDIQHNILRSITDEHQGKVSDKWSIYISEYNRLFFPYRDRPVRLLEIGIQNGGSLEIWGKYFLDADKLVGCDINPACEQLRFEDPKISLVVADANTDEAQNRILTLSDNFDLVIDDGSHQSGDIVRSFARYFPYLNDGGLYVAEDLHCSYWQDFEGGVFDPYSSMAFFKLLADTVNHEHWGIEKTRAELLRNFNLKHATRLDEVALAHIHSIEFINSMCVIRKAQPNENLLGKRVVTGKAAAIDAGPLLLNGMLGSQPKQSHNPWANRDMPVDQELALRVQQIADLNRDLHAFEAQLGNLNYVTQEQKAEFLQQLQRMQQEHAEQTSAQRQEHDQRDQAYAAQLTQARQQMETYLLQLVEREKTFAQQLFAMQQEHAQQTSAQRQEHDQRDQAYAAQLTQARQQMEAYLLQLAEREKASAQQLFAIHQEHEQQKCELSREHAKHEQAHLAEREKAFSRQLQDLQQAHVLLKSEQIRQHAESTQVLNNQVLVRQDELQGFRRQWIQAEKGYLAALSDLQQEMNTLRSTVSWRYTAPLRSLTKLISPKFHNKCLFDFLSFNIKQKLSTMNLDHPVAIAPTLNDFLNYRDDQFIRYAYKTLLLREPDRGGNDHYLSKLASGISKTQILIQISLSKEGREKNIKIDDLEYEKKKYGSLTNKITRAFSRKLQDKKFQNLKSKKSNICCIIPFYNGSDFIERALRSLYKQTISADEIIVVNDGSRDEEKSFVTNLQKKYQFTLINKQNGGQGSARNTGVNACNSKYICFLDQDDFYLPNHNETLLRGIPLGESDFGWVYGDLREADGNGLIVRMSMIKEHSTHPKHSLHDLIRNDMFVLPSASLINVDAYKSVGGFDEQFTGYEDDDLFLRLFRHGWTNTFIDKPVTVWCIHSESTSYSVKMCRSRFKYLRKLSAEFPDDLAKSRFYFRDLIVPRFGPLIVADADTAKKTLSKDRVELFEYVREYYAMTEKASGISPEYLTGLKNFISALDENKTT